MVTINDVAKEAGVSIATVSYVINKTRRVNPETAERVRQAIIKLKYRPSVIAQSLVTKSTQIIGVLISNITDPFFSPIVRGIEDKASQAGYIIMIGNSDEDFAKSKQYIEILAQHRVAGLIISPTQGMEKLKSVLEEIDVPVVLVNRHSDEVVADVVETDNELGAYMGVRHLLALGHSRISLISGPLEVSTYADRLKGYQRAFLEAGIPIPYDLIRIGGFHPDSGYRLMKELIELPHCPTAVFIGSGRLTRGAFLAVKESGVVVPNTLSLVTFDETEWGTLVNPPLTTVAQKTYEMGFTAATLLLDRLSKSNDNDWMVEEKEPEIPVKILKLPPELIVRSSTASLP